MVQDERRGAVSQAHLGPIITMQEDTGRHVSGSEVENQSGWHQELRVTPGRVDTDTPPGSQPIDFWFLQCMKVLTVNTE